jgi:hypothetical protein
MSLPYQRSEERSQTPADLGTHSIGSEGETAAAPTAARVNSAVSSAAGWCLPWRRIGSVEEMVFGARIMTP